MFQKLVAIEPVSLIPSAEKKLHLFAKEVILHEDIPVDDNEISAPVAAGRADSRLGEPGTDR